MNKQKQIIKMIANWIRELLYPVVNKFTNDQSRGKFWKNNNTSQSFFELEVYILPLFTEINKNKTIAFMFAGTNMFWAQICFGPDSDSF